MRTVGVAVVGAGVVGLACALRLSREGHEVCIVAPEDTVRTSEGNAGMIADYAVMPVGTPGVLRDLPSLLLDRNSPLAIRRGAILSLAPWLLRFVGQSLPGPAMRNARAIAALMAEAASEWRDMAAETGAGDLMRPTGGIYLFDTPAARRSALPDLAQRRELGVQVEIVTADELGQLEPRLPPVPEGAAFFPQATSVRCPRSLMARLRQAVRDAGIDQHAAPVDTLAADPAGATLTLRDGCRIRARRVVLAAGAWSRPLARAAGARVPLDTERGYHIEFDMDTPPVSRPVTPLSRGLYLSPMDGRLRVAGTVELGGLAAPPSPHRLDLLERGARSLFPDLPRRSRDWMGFRPSLPDSVPVIGPIGEGQVICAFGHGHLGLTLAPITARLVAAAVAGRPAGLDMAPYGPGRFSRFP